MQCDIVVAFVCSMLSIVIHICLVADLALHEVLMHAMEIVITRITIKSKYADVCCIAFLKTDVEVLGILWYFLVKGNGKFRLIGIKRNNQSWASFCKINELCPIVVSHHYARGAYSWKSAWAGGKDTNLP